jgi:Uma2 family endonuclease
MDFIRRDEMSIMTEECSLVHWGERSNPDSVALVGKESIESMDYFLEEAIDSLPYVQPDFCMFKDNWRIVNKKDTKTAGCPDLVVEVWSKANTANEKAFKKLLYSTSEIVEHWYIEQGSNEVERYLGCERLESQNIKNILKTTKGFSLDLRRLALQTEA